MKLEAVCFDIDGTLYPKWQTTLHLTSSLFPSPLLALKYHKFRRSVRRYPLDAHNREEFQEKQAALLGAPPEKIEKQFYAKWRTTFTKIRVYPQVRETFEWLKSLGLKVAVLSDFPIEAKLATLALDDQVDFALCSEESGYLKPHPKPFLDLSRALEVDPSALLYVGDSYSKDIVGAKAVGMSTALLTPKRLGKKGGATFTFSDYNEFKREFVNHFLKGEEL